MLLISLRLGLESMIIFYPAKCHGHTCIYVYSVIDHLHYSSFRINSLVFGRFHSQPVDL